MRLASTLLLIGTLAAPAIAWGSAVPSPANSTVPCIVGCPNGDLSFTVTVRDFGNNPVPNSFVIVSFQGASCFLHCDSPGNGYSWDSNARLASAFTNGDGQVTFSIAGSGSCASGVNVYADGILLANNIPFASTDQNADEIVNALDEAIVDSWEGQPGPGVDLDCDGIVSQDDVSIVQQHNGHICELPTPTRARTWGGLKTIYR